MAAYDSDSDLSDAGDSFTETNVLLGYASKEATDDTTSQLGGHPTWLQPDCPPPGALAKCKACNNLLTLLLQLNGDLPDRFPGHERRLYLFGCRRKTCRRKEGSIRGFRAVKASHAPDTQQSKRESQPASTPVQPTASLPPKQPTASLPPKQPTKIGESLFGVKSTSSTTSNPFNPFSTSTSTSTSSSTSNSSPLNPFAAASSLAAKPPQSPSAPSHDPTLSESFADKARISSPEPSPSAPSPIIGPAEPWPAQSSFPPPYPHYHLDADYETLDAPKSDIPANARITDMDIDAIDGSNATSGGNNDDDNKAAFESAMDSTFQKFADRLAQNPEQVLRYEFAGLPLLYNKNDSVGKKLGHAASTTDTGAKVQVAGSGGKSGMPRCTNCGADRVFELQLTPYAIVELEAEELGLEGMEWGTVILGVCAKDCVARGTKQGQIGYVEEYAAVQWEEQVSRR